MDEAPGTHRCSVTTRLEVLGRAPYFEGLSVGALENIDQKMRAQMFHVEQYIYQAGQEADELYVLAAGRVKLSQTSADGVETLSDILVPGELFGAMGALGEPVHLQSAAALVNSCVLRIGQTTFRQILEEYPTVALRVLDDLAARLTRAHADLGGGPAQPVSQRVATALLHLADKLGVVETGQPGVLLNVPLSRVDLAGLARSTPESVSRVMSNWKKHGVVASGRKWTRLLDLTHLRKVAEMAEISDI